MHFCMKLNIPWEWYRTFLAVMKEGSLSGAARMLAITQPTAGRHVAALESALGLVLFIRSQTGLQPTDAAVALQGHAQAMENTASMIERSAAGFSTRTGELRGVVRVSASEIIGTEVLPPLIAQIKEAHPQVAIELVLSNRIQDLLHREADIAVRMTRPVQEQLIARGWAVMKWVCMPHLPIWRGMPRRRVWRRCSRILWWALIKSRHLFYRL